MSTVEPGSVHQGSSPGRQKAAAVRVTLRGDQPRSMLTTRS